MNQDLRHKKIRPGFIKEALLWTFTISIILVAEYTAYGLYQNYGGCGDLPNKYRMEHDDQPSHTYCYWWKKLGKPPYPVLQEYMSM